MKSILFLKLNLMPNLTCKVIFYMFFEIPIFVTNNFLEKIQEVLISQPGK
jgi:hypothetical protein